MFGVPVLVGVLLVFIGAGIHAVIRPKRHMNAYLRRGGEMLREFNEITVQMFGVVFASASAWMLYHVVRDIWSQCFG